MIKVLIVNDSFMCQEMLKRTIRTDPALSLVGIANNGKEAIELVQSRMPDIVLMDICMPEMNGVEATLQIMKENPLPILIVTATIKGHMSAIYDALKYGALEAIKTPTLEKTTELIERIKIVSQLDSTLMNTLNSSETEIFEKEKTLSSDMSKTRKMANSLVAIGASTGGPQALIQALKSIPADVPASFLIIQHIDVDFSSGFAEWLDKNCDVAISEAKEGDLLTVGKGYVCAGNKNMMVSSAGKIEYAKESPVGVIAPSIDVCFKSVAEHYGEKAVGVLLTGMGKDGAKGLKEIQVAGGKTIAQDQETSLIYGMPKAAKEMGAADFVLPLKSVTFKIMEIIKDHNRTYKNVA